MFRHNLSQTGIPYLIFALLLVGTIILVENNFSSQIDDIPAIEIVSNSDESFEDASLISTPNFIKPKISILIQELINSKVSFTDIKSQPHVQALSKDEHIDLYQGLAQEFYNRNNYNNVIKSLQSFTFNQRLEYKTQFIYAYSLSKSSDWQAAIKQYQLMIEGGTQSQAATLNLGLLLKKGQLCEQAIPIFTKSVAISSGTKKAKALSGLAHCHFSLSNFDDAITYYKKSIEYRPNSAHVWLMLAKSLAAKADNYQQALDTFKKAIALNAQDYKSYLHTAKFQLSNYDYAGALATLKEAQPLSNNLDIYELMAWAYIEQGKRSLARKNLLYTSKHTTSKRQKRRADFMLLYVDKEYQQLLSQLKKRKKLSDDMLYLKAITYRKVYYYTSAFKVLDKIQNKQSLNARSQIQKARMTRSRKQYDNALKLYETLLSNNDNTAFLWFEAALTHESNQQLKQAHTKISQAIKLQPDNTIYKLTQARHLVLLEKEEEALNVLESVLKHEPNNVRALKQLAKLFSSEGNYNELITIYNKLLSINSSDYTTLLELSKSLIIIKKDAAAIKFLIQLLEEQSTNLEARYLLAQSYYNLNKFTEGLNELENLLKLDQNNHQAITLKNIIISKM